MLLPAAAAAAACCALPPTDSKLLLTACDDMHANLYDVHQGALIDAFSGAQHGLESCRVCAVRIVGSVLL
jgi:hypothetical protein